MGDRASVMVREVAGGTIWLYTHWNGPVWPERLRVALGKCRDQWTYEPYLTRWLATSMFADLDGTTGGGISTERGDNDECPVIVVDVASQLVSFASEGSELDPGAWYGGHSFRAYVAQERATWPS